MKSFSRVCLTILLTIAVLVVLGVWYWGLILLAFYQIFPTKYSIYWTKYVDNLWYYIWACYHKGELWE